jgi:hypothetical protein
VISEREILVNARERGVDLLRQLVDSNSASQRSAARA